MTEGERLARFSEMVRESSLKRFRRVASEDRGWRPALHQLSFTDILKHLADADRWIMAILKNDKHIPRASVQPDAWFLQMMTDEISINAVHDGDR